MEQSPARSTRQRTATTIGGKARRLPTLLRAGQAPLFMGFIIGLSFRSIWNSVVVVMPTAYTNEVASFTATPPEAEKKKSKSKRSSKGCTVQHKPLGECPGDMSCFMPAAKDLVAEGFGTVVEVGSYDGRNAFEIDRDIGGGEGAGSLRRVFSYEASSKNFRRSVVSYPPYSYPRIQFVQEIVTDRNVEFIPFLDDGGSGACVDCSVGLGGDDENDMLEYIPGVRLQDSRPLRRDPGLVDVGAIKIDIQGHETFAIAGMMEWLRNDDIAPPFLQFEFDVCLMLSNNRTTRADIVHMLESLVDAGYTLQDGAVSRFESFYYTTVQMQLTKVSFDLLMRWKEKLDGRESPNEPNPVEVDSIDQDLVRQVEEAHAKFVNERPTDCAALVDWYCPLDRPWNVMRTYTNMLAWKVPERRRQRHNNNNTQQE